MCVFIWNKVLFVENWHAKHSPYHVPDLSVQRPEFPHIISEIMKHLYLVIPAPGDMLILTNIKILSRFPGQESDIFSRSYLILRADGEFQVSHLNQLGLILWKDFHFYHIFVFLSLMDVPVDFNSTLLRMNCCGLTAASHHKIHLRKSALIHDVRIISGSD